MVTSSSYSKDKSVLLDLQKYTRLLSKELNVSESFFHYVGGETNVVEKLKRLKNDCTKIRHIGDYRNDKYC